jgi:hypothetical protein
LPYPVVLATTSTTVPAADASTGVPRSSAPAMLKSIAFTTSVEWW